MTKAALAEATETTRDRLVAVALQLFRQRGYEGTSLAAVAEQLQISAPAVYYHFSSKDELLFETQKAYMLEMLEALQRQTAQGTAVERLRAFVVTHARAQLDTILPGQEQHAFGVVQMIRFLQGPQRERIKQISRRVLDLLREILRQGVADGSFARVDPTVAAFAIIGMNHHLVAWFKPTGDLTADAVAELQADFAVRLAGAAAGPSPAVRARVHPPRRRTTG